MGGFGSGDWSNLLYRKIAVEQCRVLSVKQLRLAGMFNGVDNLRLEWQGGYGRFAGAASVRFDGAALYVQQSGQDYRVELERTSCRFGGWRYWFLCPVVKDGVYCGNRVAKLFLPPGGSIFGCRHCYDLTYQSCQQSHKYDKVFGHIENADIDSLSVTQALRLGGL